MATTIMLDFREGEQFVKTGNEIRKAIKSHIHNSLSQELTTFMDEVQGELQGQDHTQAAALFLVVMLNQSLSPKALLIRRCLERAVECQQEIDTLTYIANNLHESQDVLYKLSLDQVIRYGMEAKGEQ